jgi:hypothetical protein
MPDLPIACTLTPAELEHRKASLLPGLVARAVEQLALPNGVRWRFAPTDDLLAALTPVIEAERRCYRFLRFVVAVEPTGGSISLAVTGPPGTREFLEQLVSGPAT